MGCRSSKSDSRIEPKSKEQDIECIGNLNKETSVENVEIVQKQQAVEFSAEIITTEKIASERGQEAVSEDVEVTAKEETFKITPNEKTHLWYLLERIYSIGIVRKALLAYFKSAIKWKLGSIKVDNLDIEPSSDGESIIINKDSTPGSQSVIHVVHFADNIVVYVFQTFREEGQFLSAPYLLDSANDGEVVKCAILNIDDFLKRTNPVEALANEALPKLFSLGGAQFKWIQEGAPKDFKVQKEGINPLYFGLQEKLDYWVVIATNILQKALCAIFYNTSSPIQVQQALIDYFNPLLVSGAQHMKVISSDSNAYIEPISALNQLVFKKDFTPPDKFIIHVVNFQPTPENEPIVVYVFQVFIGTDMYLTSPYIPSSSGDPIVCSFLKINKYLEEPDPVKALTQEALPILFGLGSELFKWIGGRSTLDFKISKKSSGGDTIYWHFTSVDGIANLTPTETEALLVEML